MKKRNLFAVSASISVFVHALLLAAVYFLQLPGLTASINPPLAPEKIFNVKTVTLPPLPPEEKGSGAKRTETYVQKIQFDKPASGVDQKIKGKLIEGPQLKAPENLASAPLQKLTLEDFAPRKLPSLNDTGEALKEAVQLPKRLTPSPSTIHQPVLPVSPEKILPEDENIETPKDFLEHMPAFTPESVSRNSSTGKISRPDALGVFSGSGVYKANPNFQPLDQYLGVKIQTYRDPEDGQGYYRISIYPFAEAKVLQVLPKEVVFLVDASLSIQDRRLYAFKEGIKHALQHLNKGDLFNIYVFKNNIVPFAPKPLSAGPAEIQSALEFLDELKPSQTTDLYQAFFDTLKQPPAAVPSYMMLLSDGKPTSGEGSTTRLIAEITKANNHTRPIFAFSGGARVNRFLLDFLAYPNRGWSEYARSNADIKERLMEFTDKIQNPVLTNVRYQLTQLNEDEVYPKHLTDIYQDTFFTIYGRFKDESRFSVRVTGEADDVNKEFIFSGDLTQAPQGDRDIARFWAFNKVYHLISKMVLEGATDAEKKEIQNLTTHFQLEIPYNLAEIEKKN